LSDKNLNYNLIFRKKSGINTLLSLRLSRRIGNNRAVYGILSLMFLKVPISYKPA